MAKFPFIQLGCARCNGCAAEAHRRIRRAEGATRDEIFEETRKWGYGIPAAGVAM